MMTADLRMEIERHCSVATSRPPTRGVKVYYQTPSMKADMTAFKNIGREEIPKALSSTQGTPTGGMLGAPAKARNGGKF